MSQTSGFTVYEVSAFRSSSRRFSRPIVTHATSQCYGALDKICQYLCLVMMPDTIFHSSLLLTFSILTESAPVCIELLGPIRWTAKRSAGDAGHNEDPWVPLKNRYTVAKTNLETQQFHKPKDEGHC